jgi:hypothetical protein
MKAMTMMELKKEGSTLLRQKSSSVENDAMWCMYLCEIRQLVL